MTVAELRAAIERQKEMHLNTLVVVVPGRKGGNTANVLGQRADVLDTTNPKGTVVALDIEKLDRWLTKQEKRAR